MLKKKFEWYSRRRKRNIVEGIRNIEQGTRNEEQGMMILVTTGDFISGMLPDYTLPISFISRIILNGSSPRFFVFDVSDIFNSS